MPLQENYCLKSPIRQAKQKQLRVLVNIPDILMDCEPVGNGQYKPLRDISIRLVQQ
jgi:hypothetical protein